MNDDEHLADTLETKYKKKMGWSQINGKGVLNDTFQSTNPSLKSVFKKIEK